MLGTFEYDEKDRAWRECIAHAARLKRMGLTKRFGVKVRPVRVPRRGLQFWLELIDRGEKS